MRQDIWQARIRVTLFSLVLGGAATSAAATLSGTLPTAASAGVVLAAECVDSGSGAPASLTIDVSNLAPVSGALVGAQIRKGTLATNTTDPVDDDGAPSPVVFVNGGAGRYDVYVDKTAAGQEAFSVTAQCWTGAGGTGSPAGTTLFATQGGSVPAGSAASVLLLGAALMGSAWTRLTRQRPEPSI